MDMDQLSKLVRDRCPTDEPLALIQSAVEVSSDVNRIADAVVSHYVDHAREAGHSWAEIGEALGVSKQAVHQRFVTQAATEAATFDRSPGAARFTDRARRALTVAQAKAIELNHNFLGTEHLLLGVLADPGALATVALASFGVTEELAASRIETMIGRGTGPIAPPIPFTPRAKKALDRTIAEALKLGHNYVGTEHVALALYAEKDGVAARVMKELGVKKKSDLEKKVVQLLERGPGAASG